MAGGALLNASVLGVQLEKVRSKVPKLFNLPNVLWAKIEKKGEVISNRDARIPFKLRPGGAFGLYNPDSGDMGSGTASTWDYATVGSAHFRVGYEMSKLAKIGTNSPEKAVLNAAKEAVKDATDQMRNGLDQAMNQDYTGELGIVGSITGDVITLKTSGTGSDFAANARFQVGQRILVGNTGLTGFRNSGEALGPISQVDHVSGKITLGGAGAASVSSNDRLFLEGSTLDVVTTNACTSVSLLGIPYHQSSAQTGTWLSKNRANYPEVWTPTVSASSAQLTAAMVRLAKNKIRIAMGADPGKLVAYTHPAQSHAYEELGQIISEIHKGASSEAMDVFFDEDKMKMDGTPLVVSLNANPTRIDFLDLDKWGRVVTEEIEMHTVGGQNTFPKYGASGGLAAAELFYLVVSTQVFNESPRSGAYISSLAKISGY